MSEKSTTTSSTGHALAEANWLDTHFEVARNEYEAMIRDAGLQLGWHVLDAGCGGGSFLPLMSELVGSTGRITALDLAPENIAIVEQRIAEGQFVCPIDTKLSTITELPFADDTFDAIWCANVVQYLTKTEFHQAAAEFYRVLKPGGLLALKEVDLTALQFGPLEPARIWHMLESLYKNVPMLVGVHTLHFPTWLRDVGFVIHGRKTYLGDDQHPLSKEQIQLVRGAMGFYMDIVEKATDIPEEEKAIWREKIADVDSPTHIIHDPNFYLRRPYALIRASVPA